jgi:hypothetical protein
MFMKKLLLATTMCALMCVHAHARPTQLPKAMLGTWCQDEVHDCSITYVHGKGSDCLQVTRSSLWMPPNSMFSISGDCKFIRMHADYNVRMRCSGKMTNFIFQLHDDKLTLW